MLAKIKYTRRLFLSVRLKMYLCKTSKTFTKKQLLLILQEETFTNYYWKKGRLASLLDFKKSRQNQGRTQRGGKDKGAVPPLELKDITLFQSETKE